MPAAYWVIAWRSVSDQSAVDRYAATAGSVIRASGRRILARGLPAKTYEAGLSARLVVIEFESLSAAISAYESGEYQVAVEHLRGAAERDVRVIEAVS
jgi:uncharacterized protein (DUF1330 family)